MTDPHSELVHPFKALYIHIPFCRSKCIYCDFDSASTASSSVARSVDPYVTSLVRRIRSFGEAGLLSGIQTVYVGGGTPSILGDTLVDLVRLVLVYCKPAEFTCEANPDSFDLDFARALSQAGVTRISFGVQSLNDDELKAVGRIHTAEIALNAIRCAIQFGLIVSADLMCGLPKQSLASWRDSLARIISSGVEHVSVYPLTVEDATPLSRLVSLGKVLLPDEDFQAMCMSEARDALKRAGFMPYEVASYARAGHVCRHNIAYWTGVPYLGIGRSAAGMFSACDASGLSPYFSGLSDREQMASGRIRYVQLDDSAHRFDYEVVSDREAASEDLMLGCRLTSGTPAPRLDELSKRISLPEVARSCDRACALGLARWVDSRGAEISNVDSTSLISSSRSLLQPTELGWLEGNVLFELFWDLAESSDKID